MSRGKIKYLHIIIIYNNIINTKNMPPFTISAALPDSTGVAPLPGQSLPSSAVGLGIPNQPAAPVGAFLSSFSSESQRPALTQPPKDNFRGNAIASFGQPAVDKFLNIIRTNGDDNVAFQQLLIDFVGQTFMTPGNIDPKMGEYDMQFRTKLVNAARRLITNPADNQGNNGRNGFWAVLCSLGQHVRPKSGGRKTARSRSRSRSGKKTRARKLKQGSRKRAVRRR
jgi:hypothetical protein